MSRSRPTARSSWSGAPYGRRRLRLRRGPLQRRRQPRHDLRHRRGKVTTDFGGGADYAHGVAIQTDGKIVVAGHAAPRERQRLRPGALQRRRQPRHDLRQRRQGHHEHRRRHRSRRRGHAAARRQDRGGRRRSIPCGTSTTTSRLARYDRQRQPRHELRQCAARSWATTGSAHGRRRAAGRQDRRRRRRPQQPAPVNFDFVLARYDADGSLDSTFGNGGRVTDRLSAPIDDFGAGVAVQSDGKIVVVGRSESNHDLRPRHRALPIRRRASTRASATGGTLTTDFNGSGDSGQDVAIQPDGKIVVAGYAANGPVTEAVLVRVDP